MSKDFSSLRLSLQGKLRGLSNLLLPHQCPTCFKHLKTRGLCGPCWKELTFISDPCCQVCGYPFAFKATGEGCLCGSCLTHPPIFEKARSVLAYTDASKKLLFAFKHGRNLGLVPLLSNWLMHKDPQLFKDIDLVLPVPLHWSRLWYRRFNQSAILAKTLSQCVGLTYEPTALKRIRTTPSQGKLRPNERLENVKKAFKVPLSKQQLVKNKKLLLIDDVHTTGATLNACASALKTAGAKTIWTLTLARAIRAL